MIYLASPYSHPDNRVEDFRALAAIGHAAKMIADGDVVYSPIAHSWQMARMFGAGGDWETWAAHDEAMIRRCQTLMILKLDGWEESKGVMAERKLALDFGLAVGGMYPRPDIITRAMALARIEGWEERDPQDEMDFSCFGPGLVEVNENLNRTIERMHKTHAAEVKCLRARIREMSADRAKLTEAGR